MQNLTGTKKIKKVFTYFPLWILIAFTLGAAIFNQPSLMAFGLGTVIMTLIIRIHTLRTQQQTLPLLSEISPLVRNEYNALRQRYLAIENLVNSNSNLPAIRVVGQEALNESQELLTQSVKMLDQRVQVMKFMGQLSSSNEQNSSYTLALSKIDQGILESQQTLDELRNKLNEVILQSVDAPQNENNIKQTILRLKSLNSSLTEADQFFNQQNLGN